MCTLFFLASLLQLLSVCAAVLSSLPPTSPANYSCFQLGQAKTNICSPYKNGFSISATLGGGHKPSQAAALGGGFSNLQLVASNSVGPLVKKHIQESQPRNIFKKNY